MELCYRLTCNPWSDRGAVILGDLLRREGGMVKNVEVTAGEIIIHFYGEVTNEQIASRLAEIMQVRTDDLFVPNSLARALTQLRGHSISVTDERGRKASDLTVMVRPDEVVALKERKIVVKAGENKIYRLTASYPGMPADLRGINDNSNAIAQQVVEEMTDAPPEKAGACALGDTVTKHLAPLTQSLHIFANKHHNASIRGFGSGNGYFRAGATWRYALALSATEMYHPFFEARDKGTTVLLPITNDFNFLSAIHKRFKSGVLDDIRQFDVPTSATNIPHLYKADAYSSLVSLMHCLRNRLTLDVDTDDWAERTLLPRLTRWTTAQFKRATYVSFGTFKTIEVDHRLFGYVKPLPFQRKGQMAIEYMVVPQVFNRMTWPDTGIAGRFSQALVESSGSAMKTVLWEMYKTSSGFTFYYRKDEIAPLVLFDAFLDHFVKETYNHMDIEIRNAAKDMGKLVGRAFPRDLTLLSKIYNIQDASGLREAIKMVLFRLEKMGIDQAKRTNISEHERLWPIRNKPFETLLEGITDSNCREIADVFSIFASLNAFNANVGGKSDALSGNISPLVPVGANESEEAE
ncbi:MAG: hypothetical protein JWL77_1122 [Chthonomonadaceae bacterium]|nr:hypothetical protein [Chthonomonadaceae bacterium]